MSISANKIVCVFFITNVTLVIDEILVVCNTELQEVNRNTPIQNNFQYEKQELSPISLVWAHDVLALENILVALTKEI